jgi:hypothetical protein
MAAGTKRLEIIVTATTKGATRAFNRLKKGMKSVVAAGKRLGIGLAAGFSVATVAVFAFTKSMLDSEDALAKSARALGLTTEELAALRQTAKFAGIEVSAMDKSIQFMQRNIAEAADGTAAQADAFKALGLSIEDLSKAGPADAMAQIVEALKGIDDQNRKTQISMDIFGRSGAKLLNVTADAFARGQKEAKLFGLAMDEVSSGEVEQINDNLTTLLSALGGFGKTIIANLSAPLLKATESAKKFVESGGLLKFAKTLADFLISAIPKGIIIVINVVSRLMTAFRGWQMLLQEIKILWLNILLIIQKGITLAARFGGADTLAEQKRVQEEIIRDRDKAIQQQIKLVEGQKKEQTGIEQIKKDIDGFVKSLNDGTGSVVEQTEKVNKLADAYDRAAKSAGNVSIGAGASSGRRTFGDENLLTNLERNEGS